MIKQEAVARLAALKEEIQAALKEAGEICDKHELFISFPLGTRYGSPATMAFRPDWLSSEGSCGWLNGDHEEYPEQVPLDMLESLAYSHHGWQII